MSTSTIKIYLAGPDVFEKDPIAKGAELKALCSKHGVMGLYPMDNELSDLESGSHELASYIRTANMDLIKQSDAIIANMTPFRGASMDVGTAYEMGVAAALGKVVIGYTDDRRSYVEKVSALQKVERAQDGYLRGENGMSVEEFKGEDGKGAIDNLMMCGGGMDSPLCNSAEEAIQAVISQFKLRGEQK